MKCSNVIDLEIKSAGINCGIANMINNCVESNLPAKHWGEQMIFIYLKPSASLLHQRSAPPKAVSFHSVHFMRFERINKIKACKTRRALGDRQRRCRSYYGQNQNLWVSDEVTKRWVLIKDGAKKIDFQSVCIVVIISIN
jgi:hypothetical protein